MAASLALSSASPLNRTNPSIATAASLHQPHIRRRNRLTFFAAASSSSAAFKASSFPASILHPLRRAHQKTAAAALASEPGSRTRRMIRCELVALRSDDSKASVSVHDPQPSVSASSLSPGGGDMIGARVRVKVPLKVFHVQRVSEVDLTGMEGQLKQYVGVWKGKRLSPNLPYRVEFVTHVEGRGPIKFFAHLKEDEFDYIDT